MTDRLAHKQTAAMFTLMVMGREVSNTELRELVGFALDGKDRRAVNDMGFVNSRTIKRCYHHELTDEGFDWCRREMKALTPPPPAPRSTFARALYVLLARLDEYLRRENVPVSRVFVPDVDLTPEQIEDRIRAAYRELARDSLDWVRLAELRPMLGRVPVEEVNDVLEQLSRSGRAHLTPRADRKALTGADHAAAIRIGNEDKHLISIEAS